jgi:uncharacterized protein (TIGR03435 family)
MRRIYRCLLPLLLSISFISIHCLSRFPKQEAGRNDSTSGTQSVAASEPVQDGRSETKLAFEVVSIRPSKPGGELAFGPTPDGYSAHNTPLYWLIMDAYFPKAMAFWRSDRVQGAPSWLGTDEYDVEARVDEATAEEFAHLTDEERERRLKPMLRTMLQERCKLVLHQIDTEAPIYALMVGRHGPKLQESSPGESKQTSGIHIGDGGVMVPFHQEGASRAFHFSQTSMAALAEVLSGLATLSDVPVVDQTGLIARYDFVLVKREEEAGPAGPQVVTGPNPERASRWDVEALGLELKRVKGPMPALVIEHIDRPTPN